MGEKYEKKNKWKRRMEKPKTKYKEKEENQKKDMGKF